MKIDSPAIRLWGTAALLLLLTACATQEPYRVPPQVQAPAPTVQMPAAPPPVVFEPPPSCREDTAAHLNRSGIEMFPFMRTCFADVDGDGVQEMIVGGKSGAVTLYRSDPSAPGRWQKAPGYFSGVKVGAFSSPAFADLDGDGIAELAVGTGGFSSESGRVVIYRNSGDRRDPRWERMSDPGISVGNDAAVTAADYDGDGRPDLIIGNSEGRISFFRNTSSPGRISFVRDASPLGSRRFDMYAVPAAVRISNKVHLVIGAGNGKVYRFDLEHGGKGLKASERKISLNAKTFATPAFASLVAPSLPDLVLSDGDGTIAYYENVSRDFSSLRRREGLFGERFYAGPACTPTLSSIRGKTFMVVGNIDGTIRLFEHRGSTTGISWIERPDYFRGIKVAGFSRGVLTTFEGRELLITGQGNGTVRAFFNTGKTDRPSWKEQAGFFKGVNVPQHSTPAVFDMDGDGAWELISGAGDGRIYVFKLVTRTPPESAPPKGKIAKLIKPKKTSNPERVWERIYSPLDNIRVGGFSAPSLARDGETVHLFVGQQDGRVRIFTADLRSGSDARSWRVSETDMSSPLVVAEYCSPFVTVHGDRFEVLAGDYNGNLRHFVCNKDLK